MDRTNEFFATIKSRREKPQYLQRGRIRFESEPLQYTGKAVDLAVDRRYRDFMKISQECSHRIGNSCEKLQQLTKLARQRTIFDDGQLNLLIAEIRADISESKRQLDELQSRSVSKQQHSENIVSTLQQRLANVTSDFKSALEIRSRSVQEQSERLERYTRPDAITLPSTSGGYDSSVVDSYQPMQHQQTLLQEDQIDVSERADKMHLIESTIVELGTVFNQLAHMVQTQGETITRIDMNISETTDNVEAAHDALLRYFASINSNRWLMLKVFGILFLFFILFVVFAA